MANSTEPAATPSSKTWFSRRPKQRILTAPLPDPIAENIEAIITLHRQEAEKASATEQILEVVASWFSRPTFLYLLLLSLGLWLGGDALLVRSTDRCRRVAGYGEWRADERSQWGLCRH